MKLGKLLIGDMQLYIDMFIQHCRQVIFPTKDKKDLEEIPHSHWIFVSSAVDSSAQEEQFQEKFGPSAHIGWGRHPSVPTNQELTKLVVDLGAANPRH